MAGRHRLPPNAVNLREVPLSRAPHRSHNTALIDDPRHLQRATRPHLSPIEERIAAQHGEIQTLLRDNQRLAATHLALKQELAAAQQELRHLSAAAVDVKAERDAQIREVYERSLKMDAEVRAIDAMNGELAQVRVNIQKLRMEKQELTTELETIDIDLAKARPESQKLPEIRAEIESMHQELQRGRAAIEYEKKTHASNLEHGRKMEKSMITIDREIQKLRAELANAEKRARAAAAAANPNPAYHVSYGSPDMGYGGGPYVDPYKVPQV